MIDRENVVAQCEWAIKQSSPTIIEAKKFYEEVLELLKVVKPISEHHLFICPVCKNTLFREQKFCHECGKRIEWEGR